MSRTTVPFNHLFCEFKQKYVKSSKIVSSINEIEFCQFGRYALIEHIMLPSCLLLGTDDDCSP